MGTEMQKLKDTLFGENGMGATNIRIFPGTSRETTPEEITKCINDSIQEIVEGRAEPITTFDD